MYNLGGTRHVGPRTLKNAAIAVVALVMIGAIAAMSTNAAYSAIPSASQVNPYDLPVSLSSPQVIHALHSDTSLPLRSMPRVVLPPGKPHLDLKEIENQIQFIKYPQPAFAPVDT